MRDIADILSQAETRDDYAWIDLLVAALDALHNDEDVKLDDVDEVFLVPDEAVDHEDMLGDDHAAAGIEDDDAHQGSVEEEEED